MYAPELLMRMKEYIPNPSLSAKLDSIFKETINKK